MNEESKNDTSDAVLQDEPINNNWANAPTLSDLKQNFTDAQSDHSNHTSKVQTWLDNLNVEGKAKVQAKKNRSTLVPKVIRKQAEWRYSALTEPFLSTDDVFNISPKTHEDVKASEQNQILLNYQFNTKIDKTTFIDDYVRTAVDEGTVVLRTGWITEEDDVEEELPVYGFRYDPQFMEPLQEMIQMSEEDPVEYAKLPSHMREAIDRSVEQQRPIAPYRTGEVTTQVSRKIVRNHPTVEVCDYRNVIIDPTCFGDLEKAQFVIYSYETTLSELRKEGKYTNLDRIVAATAESTLVEPYNSHQDQPSFSFVDDARKKIIAYEYWGFWDINDNGIVQPIVATWVGNTLIQLADNPFPDKKLPFVKVQYLPKRKEVYGEPDGALLEDNQKVVGAVTRGMIDIMARSSNGQVGTKKDFLDTTNRRKFRNGDDYEYNPTSDPRLAVHQHKFEEIPNSAGIMLQHQHADAESLTGVKTYATEGISGAALGDTASLGRSALDAASKREVGILRRLAQGIIKVGYKWTAMNAVFLNESEIVRLTNDDFVEVRRDNLNGDMDMKVTISTAEEDNAKAQELSFMLQTVGPNADPKVTFMIMADIAKLRKMPALAKKLEEFEPQPDPIAQEKAMLENELLKAQIAAEYGKPGALQAKAQLDQAKIGTEIAKAENLQSETDNNNLNFVEQESGTNHARDMDKQGAQARANIELEMAKRLINGADDAPQTPVQ